MRKKYYVGISSGYGIGIGRRDVFLSVTTPTEESHGENYMIVVGPFRTKRGAQFMAKYGENNPHCQTVADAERLAKMGEE